jgi:predicted RNA-binding protein with PUA-like domain
MEHAWLMKSEPNEFSVQDLADSPEQKTGWFGIRNYQARNLIRDNLQIGDLVFFYHSSCPEPGIVGIARVVSHAYPDPSQYDVSSPYYDPGSLPESPRWLQVDIQLERIVPLLGLKRLRTIPGLENMRLLQKGNRLSISPVSEAETTILLDLL